MGVLLYSLLFASELGLTIIERTPEVISQFSGIDVQPAEIIAMRNVLLPVFQGLVKKFPLALHAGDCACCGSPAGKMPDGQAYSVQEKPVPTYVSHTLYFPRGPVNDPEELAKDLLSSELPASLFVAQIPNRGQSVSHTQCFDDLAGPQNPGKYVTAAKSATPARNWLNAVSIVVVQ